MRANIILGEIHTQNTKTPQRGFSCVSGARENNLVRGSRKYGCFLYTFRQLGGKEVREHETELAESIRNHRR